MLLGEHVGRAVPLEDVRWQVRDPDVGVVDRDRLVLGETPGQYPASVRATAALGGAYEGRAVSADLDVLVQRPLELVRGVAANRKAIDEAISSCSTQWKVERLATVDRNILRIATYELLFEPDVPPEVAMDEAVDQDAAVVYPPFSEAPARITREHEVLVRPEGIGAALTVPLAHDGKIIGA
ncbi:MAG: hypothetical protein IH804_01855, partial [Planctomycetes bacterium]|nr:hypothetical protein [Planctomycetota bacterium]